MSEFEIKSEVIENPEMPISLSGNIEEKNSDDDYVQNILHIRGKLAAAAGVLKVSDQQVS